MLRGLTTVTYLAGDVAAAVHWYTDLLGVEPYFSRPVEGTLAYAEFRIGDYQHELGILDRRFEAPGRSDKHGGAIVYWHVDDVQASGHRPLRQPSRRDVQPALSGCPRGAARSLT
jgi:catechol 2,3-dioxygenase-like lactoylglutathione lyase family enzyme